jgi:hypothetical protein
VPRIVYHDFDVIFSPGKEANQYSAEVHGSSGDGDSVFTISEIFQNSAHKTQNESFKKVELTGSVEETADCFFADREPPNFEDAKIWGGRLFESVFKGSLGKAFYLKREQLRQSKVRLRLRLNLSETPELATMPWEFLYNAELNHFYAQLLGTPIVRYLDSTEPIEELTVEGVLRVLVVVASPADAEALDTDSERLKLEKALGPLINKGLVSITYLPRATLPALQEKLQEHLQTDPFHIFHFVGHAAFFPEDKRGFLLFEDEDGNGNLISGEQLSVVLQGQGLSLAVLNAC